MPTVNRGNSLADGAVTRGAVRRSSAGAFLCWDKCLQTREAVGQSVACAWDGGLSCLVGVLPGTAPDPHLGKKRSAQGHNVSGTV